MNKIDLIVDALEYASQFAYDITTKESINGIDEALAAARELKALKPVAWGAKSIYGGFEGLSFDKQPRFSTPLYALDNQETK
jgi:hypothetical protein